MNTSQRRIPVIATAVIAAGIIALLAFLAIEHSFFQQVISFIDEDMAPSLFIISMIILPVVGFPVSIFLIMGGVKFGIFYAILLWLLILPLHALIGYYLARLLRKPLKTVSNKMGYNVPELPEKNRGIFSFLFFAIPGIPYSGKNYLLALAGAPFSYCVIMNVTVQFPQGIPFVILGRSAMELDLTLLFIALFIIAIIYLFFRWLKKNTGIG